MSPATEEGGRDPARVPVTLVTSEAGLAAFADDVRTAVRLAIDTETVYRPGDSGAVGALRVVSAALRRPDGSEAAWVIDRRELGVHALAGALGGLEADAWNAGFDDSVLERDVFRPAGVGRGQGVRWWDAQLADALLHAGLRSWYHGLAWASEHHLGIVAEGKGTTQLSYDADSELTPAQVAYAAADAVETLWVGDVLRQRLVEEGLLVVAGLEMAALPFLADLERRGVPVDRAGCAEALARADRALAGVRTTLAELTAGGQGNLFTPDVEPTWDPSSASDVRAALNRWARAEVEALLARREGAPRLLTADDAVDDALLGELGCPLAASLQRDRQVRALRAGLEALLAQLPADGRLRPRYLQVVGTPDGRPTSAAPDLARLPPAVLAHARPAVAGRAFVEVGLLPAGGGGGAGTDGTDRGADANGAAGGPGTAGTERVPPIDWARTLRLYDELGPLRAFRRAFRDEHRRWPSRPELRSARPTVPAWVLEHEQAVALGVDGAPLHWVAASPAGRKRWFALRTADLLRRAAALVASSEDDEVRAFWRRFAGDDPLPLIGDEHAPAEVSPLGAARRRELVAGLWSWSPARTKAVLDEAAASAFAELDAARARSPEAMATADALLAVAAALGARLAPAARVDRLDVEHAGSFAAGRRAAGDVCPVAIFGHSLVLECAEGAVEDQLGELALVATRAVQDVGADAHCAVRVARRDSLAAVAEGAPAGP